MKVKGQVTVCAEVFEGIVERDTVVSLSTSDSTAESMPNSYIHTTSPMSVHVYYMCLCNRSYRQDRVYNSQTLLACNYAMFFSKCTDVEDYLGMVQLFTFRAGTTPVSCTRLQIVDNSVLENDEVFGLRLTTLEPRVTLRGDQGVVMIIDDDSE